MAKSEQVSSKPVVSQSLGFWDAVSIIVGIVVGTAVFRSPAMVFQNTESVWQAVCVWLIGGGLCLCGALCYAELATTYPRNGGDYEYLSRAYGGWAGFLFGWAQLTVVLTGSLGAMGYAFADYGSRLWSMTPTTVARVAAGTIIVLTAANLFGVVVGKSLQNILSFAKILGLALVIFVGFIWGTGDALVGEESTAPIQGPGLGLALVFVLYAFGGWNDAVFVAAEVRDQQRNIPRALLCGIAGITFLYVAINLAYLSVLGFETARQAKTPAADVLQLVMGPWGAKAISVLVMVSALGAINGMILAGSRIYATVGEDYRLFSWLGKWNERAGAPVAAIVVQSCVAVSLVFAVGTEAGRRVIDWLLQEMSLPGLPWEKYLGGFETLVAGTAPIFWAFFLLTGLSLFILRIRDPGRERPFSVPWFPIPPIIFCGTCVYMLYSSLQYAGLLSLLGLVPFAIGIPLYGLSLYLSKKSYL